MSGFFAGPESPLRRFRLFSPSHLAGIGAFAAVNILIALFSSRIRGTPLDTALRFGIGAILYVNEILLSVWRLRHGMWSVKTSLPFHLCGVSVVLCPIMLGTESYTLFELTYFWAMGGALQGLLTPDVEGFDFPHFRFITTFVSHGLIITANLYMIFVLGMRPTFLSYVKSVAVLNLYALAALAFNWVTGANYGFLCRKPDDPSLIDYLGPWPWYLASLEAVAIGLSFIFYIPFMIW
jgi:hypothetical integral membrane protein (TIGR02206 family)